MQVLRTSPDRLFRLAELRIERDDIGDTATWQLGDGGPRVLLIHGFRGDHHGLLGVAGALPEARFVIPDLPGFGKTPPLNREHSLENYSQWLTQFVSNAGEFDAILAHSFGTLVLSKAISDGLSVNKVLLQNPITTSQHGGVISSLADVYYKLGSRDGSNLLRSQLLVRGMSMALAKTPNPGLRGFIHAQHAAYFSTYATNQSIWEGYQAASRNNVLDYADALPDNLTVVAGDRDVVAPLSGQYALAKQTQAQLKIISGAGHLTHYENPTEVATSLAELLEL
ncbi:MAG: alpha/beta fold hydrolase [Actinobacteria bacterium]|nr:alpha/beta fold hydrolase [Actinomycetota bacterium]